MHLRVITLSWSEKYKSLETTFEVINLDKALSSHDSPKSTIYIASTSHGLSDVCLTSTLETNILKEYHELKSEREVVMDGFESLALGRAIHKAILS